MVTPLITWQASNSISGDANVNPLNTLSSKVMHINLAGVTVLWCPKAHSSLVLTKPFDAGVASETTKLIVVYINA